MKKKLTSAIILAAFIMQTFSVAFAAPVALTTARVKGWCEKSPSENIFKLADYPDEFILLESNDEGYFVLTKSLYGTIYFNENTTGKFDADDPNSTAYWLNGEFLENGNGGKKLPQPITDNLVEREWLTEAGAAGSSFPEDYYSKAKIAYLSNAEWLKYTMKVGFGDDTSASYYFLRSTSGEPTETSAKILIINTKISQGRYIAKTAAYSKLTRQYGVRPCFYLPKDFFERVKVDMYTAGDNVRAEIIKNSDKDGLEKLYSKKELNKLYAKMPPRITYIQFDGIPTPGYTLSCSDYIYYSPIGEPEGQHIFRWYRSASENGAKTLIKSGSSKELDLTSAEGDKYVTLEIVPYSSTQAGYSFKKTMYIQPAVAPVAENVCIKGSAVSGGRLYANYNFYDWNRDQENGTSFAWENSSDGKIWKAIDGASEITYVPTVSDIGKYIRVKVTPKSYGREPYCLGKTVVSEPTEIVKAYSSAENVSITSSGKVLTGGYTYSDNGSGLEEKGTVSYWEYSADGKDGWTVISGSEGNSYAIPSTLGGYIRFAVRPGNIYGISEESYCSLPVKAEAERKPSGENEITLTLEDNEYASLYTDGSDGTYTICFTVSGTGPIEVTGADYRIYSFEQDGKLFCVATRTGGEICKSDSAKIADIKGSGEIRINELSSSDVNGSVKTNNNILRIVREVK